MIDIQGRAEYISEVKKRASPKQTFSFQEIISAFQAALEVSFLPLSLTQLVA
jgi:hypothetical protein